MGQVGNLEDRLARLEAAHEQLLASHQRLQEAHFALLAHGTEPAGPAPSIDQRTTTTTTTRRMLIGGGIAGMAGLATGALLGAHPAAATSGAMQFGANNNAGTSGTNLTSTAVDKTLFVENTGPGQALRATAVGTGAAVTSTGGVGLDVTGKTTALDATSTTGVGLRATSTSGVGAVITSDKLGTEVVADHAQLRLRPTTVARGAPTTDAVSHQIGELVRDGTGDLWLCVDIGVPGTWRKLSGPAAAGALHVLPVPVRIYDSRVGTLPAVGTKAPFAGGQTRILDCMANSSGVPADATSVVVTLLVVNAAAGNGNFTIWADGAAKPSANTMVWGGSTGRFSSLALSALGAQAKVKVSPSVATDLAVDVVGYYR